jgi:hypothetical protein
MIEVTEITPHIRMKNNTLFIFDKIIDMFTNQMIGITVLVSVHQ